MSNLIPRQGISSGGLAPQGGAASPLPEATTVRWVQVENQSSGHNVEGETVIDLQAFWRTINQRKRLAIAVGGTIFAISLGSTLYERIFSPTFQGSFAMLIIDPMSESRRSGSIFEQLGKNSQSANVPALIQLLRSPVLLEPVARQFGTTGDSLSGRINITQAGGRGASASEGVLAVSLTGVDPIQDRKILEAISQLYLQYSLKQRQQRLSEGLSFLDRQAPALEERANQLQAQVARFREANNLLQPTEEGVALKTRLASLENQRAELKADRSRLFSVRNSIQNGTLTAQGFQEAVGTGAGGGVTVTTGAGQALLQELAKVEQQLAEAQARFTPSSTVVRGLLARRDGMVPLLRNNQLEAVSAAITLNANRTQSIDSQIARLTTQFQRQPALIKEFETLQQRLDISKQNRAGIIQARDKFQLELAQNAVPWNVISAPQFSLTPITPSINRNLTMGFLLGLIGGVGAALIRDRLDHVFHRVCEVRNDLKQPLLGHVPHMASFKGLAGHRPIPLAEFNRSSSPATMDLSVNQGHAIGYQLFSYREAFRNLYTSLRFLNTDRSLRSIAITSSQPREGKTLINILLARTLSEMGQRVLIVDADLRLPNIHHRLGLDNQFGLSNLLSSDDAHWQNAIQPVPGHPNWFALTSGPVPPDPVRLIGSERMKDFVRDVAASGQFDLILYDTPPLLGLADALLVGQHLDGLVLIVSLDRVDRSLPRESIELIRTTSVPFLGILTNALKKQKHSKGYHQATYAAYGQDYISSDDDQTTDTIQAGGLKQRGKALARKVVGWIDR